MKAQNRVYTREVKILHHTSGDKAMPEKITVIASYNTGFLIHAPRLPVEGETLMGSGFRMEHGGKGSNQAIQAARLGSHVHVVARVGHDLFGDRAISKWREEGIDHRAVVRDPEAPTGVGIIIVGPDGKNMIVVDLGANLRLTPADIDRYWEDSLSRPKVALAQLEVPVEAALHGLRRAKNEGAVTILNPAPARPMKPSELVGVDIITPNETEMRILAGEDPNSTTDIALLAERYLDSVNTVIVTLGEKGALIVDNRGKRILPPPRVKAVDTTGAGDAFNGALAKALSMGLSVDDAVSFANYAGAYLVARFKRGELVESLATRDELEEFMRSANP